jgi:hypothetical protein
MVVASKTEGQHEIFNLQHRQHQVQQNSVPTDGRSDHDETASTMTRGFGQTTSFVVLLHWTAEMMALSKDLQSEKDLDGMVRTRTAALEQMISPHEVTAHGRSLFLLLGMTANLRCA